MRLESTLNERVETFIGPPTFAGSDGVMGAVLEDLESGISARRIGQATHRRPREMIRRSPHFVPCRCLHSPRA